MKLIDKYLTGEASEQELLELDKWVAESYRNKKIFSRYAHIYACSGKNHEKSDNSDLNIIINSIRKKNRTRTNIKRVAAIGYAASIIVMAGLLYLLKTNAMRKDVGYILSQADTYLEYATPYGVKSKITMPDHSVVWLNSGSKISFPSKFSGMSREVCFSGEGYFDIVTDSLRPMNINTPNDIHIQVLGTKFNLSTYKEDKTFSLMLVSGKVKVSKNGSIIAEMKPAENFVLEHQTHKKAINIPKDPMRITGWKEGWLIFDDIPLSEVFVKMKRWYGVTAKVSDNSVFNKKFSAKFKEESASQVFDLMHKISLINYTLIDSVAHISNYCPKFEE